MTIAAWRAERLLATATRGRRTAAAAPGRRVGVGRNARRPARELLVPHRGLIRERGEYRRRLLQILLADGLVEIRVRVVQAHVVVRVVLNRRERGNPHGVEHAVLG